jgi:hypothetical protein
LSSAKELAIDVEHDDVAALDAKTLLPPGGMSVVRATMCRAMLRVRFRYSL